jgi:aquaporin NIP
MKMDSWLLRRSVAELVGTFVLVLAGCGAVMVNTQTGALGHIGVAFTFGMAILTMIAAVGHISGGHFNPAVTIAFAITRHLPWRDVLFYVIGQFIGAILAALTLRVLIGDVASLGTTLPSGTALQSFGVEILLTATLMFVIISVATDTRAVGAPAALAIGFTILLDALWGGPISGASMNPARSLGPALVSGVLTDQWVYLLAPIIGAALGGLLYQWLRQEKPAITGK